MQHEEDEHHRHQHFSLVGTPYYMSPEMIERDSYGRAVDYWALGGTCLTYPRATQGRSLGRRGQVMHDTS